jgi:hypothetical protein
VIRETAGILATRDPLNHWLTISEYLGTAGYKPTCVEVYVLGGNLFTVIKTFEELSHILLGKERPLGSIYHYYRVCLINVLPTLIKLLGWSISLQAGSTIV